MTRHGLISMVSLGAMLLGCLAVPAAAGEKQAEKDSQLAQLYVRLLGTSG